MRFGFDANVRFINTRGECVKRVRAVDLSAEVPVGAPSTVPVQGMLVCDGLEVPFTVDLPTQGGRPLVDINYTPRGQIVKQLSTARIRGTEKFVDKVTATTVSPVPNELEVWVQGRQQWVGEVAYAR